MCLSGGANKRPKITSLDVHAAINPQGSIPDGDLSQVKPLKPEAKVTAGGKAAKAKAKAKAEGGPKAKGKAKAEVDKASVQKDEKVLLSGWKIVSYTNLAAGSWKSYKRWYNKDNTPFRTLKQAIDQGFDPGEEGTD